MTFKCKIGLHAWEGCKCPKCEKTRDEQHDWSKDCEKCSKCGKTNENQHDWSKDCEKCFLCGKTRNEQHDWTKDCEKCYKCYKSRENKHDWSKDCKKCSICGKMRQNTHLFGVDCKCNKCGKEEHDWSKNCENCSKCGKVLTNQHEWSKDCEKCSKCGDIRIGQHQWDGCTCIICNKTQDGEHTFVDSGIRCVKCGFINMNENTPFSELYEYLKGGDGVIVATAARLIVNKKGTEAIYMIFNALNLGQLRNRPTDDPDLRVCIAGCAVAISLLGDKAIPILEKNATLDITKLDNSIPIVISMGALNQIGGNNAKAALDYIKEIQGSTMRQYNF